MNGHDFTLEQNTEARMMLAVARRGLAAAINDAENGIGHLSCDDPKIMEQVRAHWRRLYDTYMNADALLSDLESCARHLTDGDKWEPNPIADGMKPMEMAKGCACFIAETPDGGLIIPSEPTPGENTAKRLANTLNALTGDVLLDASGFRAPASCGAPADCQHGAHLVEDASLVLLRCLHVLIPESQGDLSLRRHADPVFHKTSQTGPVPFALIPDEAPLCTTRSKNVRHVAHAVKSRVRTIMLDRRVYRVAMQAKGGR